MVDLIAGCSAVFSFFGRMFNSLPSVFVLLAQFTVGTMLLIGMYHLLRR